MDPGKLDIKIYQGATFNKTIRWSSKVGTVVTPINITGFKIRMQIRQTIDSATILVDMNTDNGKIIIVDALDGKFKLTIPALETATLNWDGMAVFDLEVEDGLGEVFRLFEGKVKLSKNVTR